MWRRSNKLGCRRPSSLPCGGGRAACELDLGCRRPSSLPCIDPQDPAAPGSSPAAAPPWLLPSAQGRGRWPCAPAMPPPRRVVGAGLTAAVPCLERAVAMGGVAISAGGGACGPWRWAGLRRRGLGRAAGLGSGEPLLDVPAGGKGGARAVGRAHHGLLAPAQQPAEGPETGGDRGPHLVGAPGHPARRQRGVHGQRVDGHGARRDVDDQVLLAAARGQ